jgi:hypothetical protein
MNQEELMLYKHILVNCMASYVLIFEYDEYTKIAFSFN